jgi:hypothetical protein
MNQDHSRRNFLRYVPGAFFLLSAASSATAQHSSQGSAMNPGNPGTTTPVSGGSSMGGSGGGGFGGGGNGGGGGGGMGPDPAHHDGDVQTPKPLGKPDKAKEPAKPKKDLAADQKSLREQVQKLVSDTRDLKAAIEQAEARKPLSAGMLDKTKEIEKLAHNIATLAKG